MHAAKGGAQHYQCRPVGTYLDWARRNFAQRLLGPPAAGAGRRDGWLEADRGEYDLIFIDPPTFSNSKRMEGVFDVQRDHVALLDLAMARLATGGTLYFSNNFRKFVLDASLMDRYAVEEITASTLDEDFRRNPRIHRAWKLKHGDDGSARASGRPALL